MDSEIGFWEDEKIYRWNSDGTLEGSYRYYQMNINDLVYFDNVNIFIPLKMIDVIKNGYPIKNTYIRPLNKCEKFDTVKNFYKVELRGINKKNLRKKGNSFHENVHMYSNLEEFTLGKVLSKVQGNIVVKAKSKDGKSFAIKMGASQDKLEECVYRKIINALYDGNITPHVIKYYGGFTVKKHALPKSSDISHWISNFQKDTNEIYCVVVDFIDGAFIKKYAKQFTLDEWKSVLFQIFYTIYVFMCAGISHRDIHSGNIYIEPTKIKLLTYYVNSERFTIDTHGLMVKIIDYGNSDYESCRKYNTECANIVCTDQDCVCRDILPIGKVDVDIMLLNIDDYIKHDNIKPDIAKILQKFIDRHRDPKSNASTQNLESWVHISTPFQVLQDSLFEEFKNNDKLAQPEYQYSNMYIY